MDKEEQNLKPAAGSIEKSKSDKNDASSDEKRGESRLDELTKYFREKLTTLSNENKIKVLREASVDALVEHILKNNVKNIITMSGAGISTSAGIPDFRSPKTGIYHNLAKFKLPNPQCIFDINFFKIAPEPFYTLAKELMPEGYKPTVSHFFIRFLHEKGLLLRHYTQNIDNLERLAGIPDEKLVEAHGTFNSSKCLECNAFYDFDWLKEQIKKTTVPKCENCSGGVVKPDIVFFGENLPDRFHRMVENDFKKADLLIVLGSSLVVQPFASLINHVPTTCPRLLINQEKVGEIHRIAKIMGSNNGFDFEDSSNRDVAFIGECDEGCRYLIRQLGWEDELDELIEKEYKRLESIANSTKKEDQSVENEKLTLLEALDQNNVTKRR
ncbi:NAD-dependent protein deacetylase sirtuin-2 [Trichogramma pretiosum]|uniref:NAD-dependent protein deacetylase sirtuin-2 n=1 Tax=Trichogramma pretiosum TaxID=7493 RepID=UPI000C719A86|nr:NAD-dependent protein deacetylase sirtuin-2 [Trichogramma pretiosum]XP_023317718.1 NAD-dependent protein deacetylase sirtuin-2 [Trichogramma pretiosum]